VAVSFTPPVFALRKPLSTESRTGQPTFAESQPTT
jgi:hypothetical protein